MFSLKQFFLNKKRMEAVLQRHYTKQERFALTGTHLLPYQRRELEERVAGFKVEIGPPITVADEVAKRFLELNFIHAINASEAPVVFAELGADISPEGTLYVDRWLLDTTKSVLTEVRQRVKDKPASSFIEVELATMAFQQHSTHSFEKTREGWFLDRPIETSGNVHTHPHKALTQLFARPSQIDYAFGSQGNYVFSIPFGSFAKKAAGLSEEKQKELAKQVSSELFDRRVLGFKYGFNPLELKITLHPLVAESAFENHDLKLPPALEREKITRLTVINFRKRTFKPRA